MGSKKSKEAISPIMSPLSHRRYELQRRQYNIFPTAADGSILSGSPFNWRMSLQELREASEPVSPIHSSTEESSESDEENDSSPKVQRLTSVIPKRTANPWFSRPLVLPIAKPTTVVASDLPP